MEDALEFMLFHQYTRSKLLPNRVWQVQEPTEQRRPLPSKVMEALVVVCWSRGWRRMAGCILLAFFG